MTAQASLSLQGDTLVLAGVLDHESVLSLEAQGATWLADTAPATCYADLTQVSYSSSAGKSVSRMASPQPPEAQPMNYAPISRPADWVNDSAGMEHMSVPDGRTGSPLAPPITGATAGAAAISAATVGADTLIEPMKRSLETTESFIPRPTSRISCILDSSNSTSGNAAHSAGPVSMGGEGNAAPPAVMALPGSPPQQHASAEARLPTMMLPGGMMEFAVSPSLLRSEVAALVVTGGPSNKAPALEARLQQ